MDRMSDVVGGDDVAIDIDGAGGATQSPFMKDFFDKVGQVKRNMDQMKRNMGTIEKTHGQALSSVSRDAANKRQEELDDLMDQTSTCMKSVKELLKQMDEEGKKHDKKVGHQDSETRIRNNMHSTLTKKFVQHVKEYQEMQTKYKNKYRERVGRQLKVVKPDATQDEIDELMDSGQQNVFSQQLLAERSTQAAKNALADIQDKHKDILRLEQSIVELHQLFVDMSVLVQQQGEMLDDIQYTVQQAHAYVDKGVQQLEKAKESQKKARKRMCCLMCCFGIILAVVVVTIFGSLLGSNVLRRSLPPPPPLFSPSDASTSTSGATPLPPSLRRTADSARPPPSLLPFPLDAAADSPPLAHSLPLAHLPP
mmetsp:Transcript_21125/g.50171  ORF Transcript_21125/g.50171 Transcript_21125/m.50171 type:complete len:366 (+) Transcript_21125:162-1259(+)